VNKIALITGSASGLAVAIAHRLARAGFTLVLNYRQGRDACVALAKTLAHEHEIEAIALAGDMTRPTDIAQLIDEISARYGRLDVLVHCAGPFLFTRKRLTEYSDDEWDEMISGNLTSAFHLLRKTIPLMRPQGFGRIITVGFERVEDAPGWVYRSAYAAAKTGLASLTRTVAQEEWENGITANMICPGDIRGQDKENTLSADADWVGLRKPLGGDLAELTNFLLTREAQFVSGNIISASGFVDVLGGFDHGRQEVFDARTLPLGARVHVLPWQREALITKRIDRPNRRSLYTVEAAGQSAEFTLDQLQEVSEDGL